MCVLSYEYIIIYRIPLCLSVCLSVPPPLRFQGEAESTLQRLFEEASLNAPALVLVDDLELLAPQRTQLLSDLQRRIVSCLLTLIDGVVSASDGQGQGQRHGQRQGGRVFIIATSSQPNLIDTAMRRPGRLDREVELGVPSPACRGEILHSLLRAMGMLSSAGSHEGAGSRQRALMHSDITEEVIRSLSKKSHGMVGADLLLVCKEAHMIALDRITGLPHRLNSHASPAAGVDYAQVAIDTMGKLSLQSTSDDGESAGIVSSKVDLNFHLDDLNAQARPLQEEETGADENVNEYRIIANDLVVALGRVTPSAIREVTIEVPGVRLVNE
jgi:SpoVK/Ycf46/Vps4 family AAA+-type ATPase